MSTGSFLRLWVGSTASRFGTALGALSFVAVVTLEATPLQVGILAAAGVIPGLVFSLAAGVCVDRTPRKPLLVIAALGRALALASVTAAFFMDALHVEHLYAAAFVNGALKMLFDVSLSTVVPVLVGRDLLLAANARLAATHSAVGIGGVSVGGWIVQLAGTMAAAGVAAGCMLLAAVMAFSVRVREPIASRSDMKEGAIRELWSGLVYVAGHQSLRPLCGGAVVEGLVHGFVGAVILIFGVRELGLDTGILATILAVGGVCSVLGSLSSGRLTRTFGTGPAIVVGFALFAVGALVLPMAQGPLLTVIAVLVAAQLAEGPYAVYEVNELSLRQSVTPDTHMGRVTATVNFAGMAAFMIASVVGGALAEVVGLRWTMAMGGAFGLAGATWLFRSPIWGVRDLSKVRT